MSSVKGWNVQLIHKQSRERKTVYMIAGSALKATRKAEAQNPGFLSFDWTLDVLAVRA